MEDMEFRGSDAGRASSGRLPIARRSCDACRARKIGCDRGSPCSNCTNARLDCTHSVVAQRTTTSRKKVITAGQSEEKINDIAAAVDDIKLLLQNLSTFSNTNRPIPATHTYPNSTDLISSGSEKQPLHDFEDEVVLTDHSVHVGRFVKDTVASRDLGLDTNDALISLRNLVRPKDNSHVMREFSFPVANSHKRMDDSGCMPPLQAAVYILRWAKDHPEYYKVSWLSRILPLDKFTEICQKVYFAVEDYTDIDFVLANGYLYWLFSEYFVISESDVYRGYCVQCRQNLHIALSRIPFILPPTMDTVAALTIGALRAIETSKGTLAWTFSSAASSLCQTLGYHRLPSTKNAQEPARNAESILFWTVYGLDRTLSLRLGRAPNIQEEVTLPPNPNESRCTKIGRIIGKTHDQLFGPSGLSRPENERIMSAEILATEVRTLIELSKNEESSSILQSDAFKDDKMRSVYLGTEQIIEYSLLTLILQVPSMSGVPSSSMSEECAAAARVTLEMYEQCVRTLHESEPFMMTKWTGWTVMHTSFVPFLVLLSRSVQFSDLNELSRLESFVASLQPKVLSSGLSARPHRHRLFELLCQVARFEIESNVATNLGHGSANQTDRFDFTSLGAGTGFGTEDILFGEWFDENQIDMTLLDDDFNF
ncbi:hypothetical protein K505DRAFT_304056 [Melanomma pulvis-pyrius CBS 109.77]|uniref:Zn(2)-C6 fungal-type domain-containing protein n=1 Tax=Melanomma pulvis-pyrius CBS 109.77 TaxID=1314802 RepID=A0A6A6XFB8_9PLEO|nr:hypothetical protein K505DRAFT_304056 [Melanomma pulvis-pyrius CBS 109.77]